MNVSSDHSGVVAPNSTDGHVLSSGSETPNQAESEHAHMTEDPEPIQDLPLSKERYAVGFGPNVAVLIAAGADPADESVYILTPHMTAPPGVGFIHTLREQDAVQLIRAVYLSLSPFNKMMAMTALEGN